MKISQLGEFGLIKRIAKRETKRAGTVIGIGDDAAVLRMSDEGTYLLVTTDALVEGVHFRRGNFFNLGCKALAANVSDIAAMGGWPTHAVVTLGLPRSLDVAAVDALYRGMDSIAKKYKVDIIGGDTVASPKAIFISITLLGEVEKGNLLLRSTARVGDLICVTGKFGGPASRKFGMQNAECGIRLLEARKIAKSKLATSMIDSSDGLVRSVLEICRASKVGARIEAKKVPIAKGATLDQVLYGGEEYELVFTVPRDRMRKLKVKHTVVGEIMHAECGIRIMDGKGRVRPLKSGGYEHFR